MFGSKRLGGLPDALPVAVAVLRAADGTVLYANPRFGALVGVPTKDLAGRRLGDVLAVPDLPAALAAGTGIEARRRDGTPLGLTASAGSVRFDGEPDARVVVCAESAPDVTALALLAELPEKNPGPVCRLAPDGTVLMANAAARAFLADGADVRGRRWHELCPGLTPALWQEALDDGRAEHESGRSGRWVSFTYVRSASGDVVFAYGADITARRRDERLLAEQAAALAEQAPFPEMNPGPVLRLGFDATVVLANAAARAVFGEALVGRPWPELCPSVATGTFWQEVLAADGVFPLEARVGGRDYVFAHRRGPRSRVVFVL